MPEPNEAYQRWIDGGLGVVEILRKQLPTIPPERYPTARYSIGSNARMAAVGMLYQGRPAEARQLFRESAEAFLKGIAPNRDNVSAELYGLEGAILTGETAFWRQVADGTPAFTGKEKPAEYPYVMFLKHALLGQAQEASRWAQEAALVSPATLVKRGWYGTVGTLVKAVDDRDAERVKTAVAEVLVEHHGKAKAAWRNQPQGHLCFPAATLLLLARELDVGVAVESPYMPKALFA